MRGKGVKRLQRCCSTWEPAQAWSVSGCEFGATCTHIREWQQPTMQGGRDRANRGVGMDDWEGGGGASKAEVGGRTLRKLKLKVHCVLAMWLTLRCSSAPSFNVLQWQC
eukprot:1987535-Prymnesium_polylepis.1